MEQILTDVLKLVIMAAVAFAVYMIRNELVPLIRSKMTAEQLQTAQKFADMFVYMAQQVFGGYPPAERKAIVTEALKNALIAVNISLTDKLIDDMIEAAVKGLRIAESSGEITANTGFEAFVVLQCLCHLEEKEIHVYFSILNLLLNQEGEPCLQYRH